MNKTIHGEGLFPNSSASSSPSTNEYVKAEYGKGFIEDRVRQSVTAMNDRDFSPSHPAWAAYNVVFSCGSISRYKQTPSEYHLQQTRDISRAGMLEVIQQFTESNPRCRTRLVDVLTCVDEKNLFAECYVTLEESNLPRGTGTVKQNVSKTVWRWLEGEWRCVDYRNIEGLDGLAGLDV
ncbi:hypothetical protein M409DRAFT_23943 [Zasmidium cellare ATCC 36951]|uniref:SnoaL-like domain-containing protein n=1 Tax=Zasmidium cellare ATCC 36951 TaxID=1080233 RepID=A0A6A6CG80_ZASCE|nr:uncharacterized protein M409DRAFT_23943 [Zasmidium cellare ATCC 36951]KAF2165653.1 hypothetical protein M409DRAFT_23943 [Zasmidium cellare ATCC 36951]